MYKIVVVLVLLYSIQCDLPVHCVKHQIAGIWTLYLESPKFYGHGQLSCGHEIPDNEVSSYTAGADSFNPDSTILLELNKKNQVRVPGHKKCSGRWTMVYDEGFEIIHDSVSYFAFSKYERNAETISSFCGQTLIGWYINKRTWERGCYKAVKNGSEEKITGQGQISHIIQPNLKEKIEFIQGKELIWEVKHHQVVVDKINSQPKNKWKAKVYPLLTGFTLSEIRRKTGRFKYNSFDRNLIETGEIKKNYKYFSMDDLSELPKSFSWEHPVREQLGCGSCYTISTMEMLSSRLRIHGVEAELSPQYSLDCNYYNQGCDGGYPYLVAKFAMDQYLLEEKDYPYRAFTQTGKCDRSAIDKVDQAYSVFAYKFIGGSYGKSGEKSIMQEIHNNGPVVLNFEPDFDFAYYESGIYHSTQAGDWIRKNLERPEWEKVDHSVLCYGWGEEDGEKYWLLQNSWGKNWGENGRFRMRRGTDESAVESMGEAADPTVVNLKEKREQKEKEKLLKAQALSTIQERIVLQTFHKIY